MLELYDTQVRAQPSTFALDMVDATALLWRLSLRGVDVGNRWQELADGWERTLEDGFYAFSDAHAMMSFIGAKRPAAKRKLLATLERRVEGRGTNAMMTRDVGLPLCRALVAFAEERYTTAVETLLDVRTIANRLGGSNAQRDLIHLTLVESAHRAARHRLAFALSAERTRFKPTSPFNWLLAARSGGAIGDRDSAADVSAQALRKARENVAAAHSRLGSAAA